MQERRGDIGLPLGKPMLVKAESKKSSNSSNTRNSNTSEKRLASTLTSDVRLGTSRDKRIEISSTWTWNLNSVDGLYHRIDSLACVVDPRYRPTVIPVFVKLIISIDFDKERKKDKARERFLKFSFGSIDRIVMRQTIEGYTDFISKIQGFIY